LLCSSNLVRSEFWDDVPVGMSVDGVLCEDVRSLTFGDDRFDIVISQDIFEHVPGPEEGFKEIYRVLKPGGHHVFTVPFSRNLEKSLVRAIVADGLTHNLLPATYHGDRLRSGGILVYTDFGKDLITTLERIGFEVEIFEDNRPEYTGGYNVVFSCVKQLRQATR
jgi:SAM-dependent methyltransferase